MAGLVMAVDLSASARLSRGVPTVQEQVARSRLVLGLPRRAGRASLRVLAWRPAKRAVRSTSTLLPLVRGLTCGCRLFGFCPNRRQLGHFRQQVGFWTE